MSNKLEIFLSNIFPILKAIRDFCFNINLGDKDLHSLLLDELVTLLFNNGYIIKREWPVIHLRFHRIWGMPIKMNGYIDLMAFNDQHRIAIEFDTGTILKDISIEKLLQSDANLLIGIAVANCEKPIFRECIDRVKKARAYSNPKGKRLWLILLHKKTMEEITVQ